MSETIIIESNREIAYRSTTEAERFATINESTNVPPREYPNHEWTTYIEAGIPLNIGDTLNIEACMINTRGSPEETMEFSGGASKIGNNPLVDNVCELEVGYYVTNRHQFNFNLPLFKHKTDFRWLSRYYGTPCVADILKMDSLYLGLGGNLTGTDPDNFNFFQSCYPYQGIEGFSQTATGTTPIVYTKLTDPYTPFTKCRIDLSNATEDRFYKTDIWWEGPQEQSTYGHVGEYGNLRAKKIPLEVPIGFNSPATVGEYLTSQFHNRDGNADAWEVDEVQGSFYSINPTQGFVRKTDTPTVTDKSFITTPTSTGQLFLGREQSKWSASFPKETLTAGGPAVTVGTGYNVEQGKKMFWANMMTADYKRNKSLSFFQQLTLNPRSGAEFTQGVNLPVGVTTFSGAEYIVDTHYGEYGSQVCLLDNMYDDGGLDLTYSNWTYVSGNTIPPTKVDTTLNNVQMMGIDVNECIVTNIVATEDNMTILKNTFFSNQYQSNEQNPVIDISPSSNANSNKVWENMRTNWQFGRADDQYSGGHSTEGLNLINPLVATYINSGDTLPQIYNSYQLFSFRDYDAPATYGVPPNVLPTYFNTMPRLIQTPILNAGKTPNSYNTANQNQSYETPLFTNMRKEFDPSRPDTVLTLPANSKFSFTNSLGAYYPINNGIIGPINNNWDTSMKNYTALAVVYFISGQEPYGTMADVPFIAVVNAYKVGVNDILIPLCMTGELFGVSSSLMNNSYAKVTSTMKNFIGEDRKPALAPTSPSYPTQTDPDDYSPYIMIGSDNPVINFDADFTRFAISSLHTATRTGNGIFQTIEAKPNDQFGQEVILVFSSEAMISGIGFDGTPQEYSKNIQNSTGNPTISSQGGIGILSMSIPTVQNILDGYLNRPDFFNLVQLSTDKPNQYSGSLFSKMGFELEQILQSWGLQNNNFNTYNATKYVGYPNGAYSKQSNMVYPMTTNAYVSASIMLSMTTNVAKDPMENLGGFRQNQKETNATSDQITALQLPSKLDYSYLVVYSDIVPNVKYYGGASGEQKIPALGYISRNYSTGDFFYSFATDWRYLVDKNYILSHFTVSIRLPNGKPAPIEDNSSIIFKVSKPKIMPPEQNPKEEKKEEKKENK